MTHNVTTALLDHLAAKRRIQAERRQQQEAEFMFWLERASDAEKAAIVADMKARINKGRALRR